MLKLFSGAVVGFLLSCFVFSGVASAQIPGIPSALAKKAAASDTASAPSPSLGDLIKILENEQTRNKLIESLKAAAYQPTGSSAPKAAAAGTAGRDEAEVRSLPGRIAEATRMLFDSLGADWNSVRSYVAASVTMLRGAGSINIPNILAAILPVGLVAIVVFLILAATRLVKTPIFRRLDHTAEHSGPVRKLFLLVVSAVVDALSIGLSWAAGYVAALIFFGGRPGINQALFLNAFLVIEMIKVLLAAFVAPNFPHLRLTPFSNRQASYWFFWLSRIISFIGYTFTFVAPIVQQSSNLRAADAVRFIVVFVSLCVMIGLIIKNRQIVHERLKRARQRGDKSLGGFIKFVIAPIWWILAIGFVVSLFVVWLRSPQDGFAFMTLATIKSLVAMAVGGLLINILTRVIHAGIPIPEEMKNRLPLLERRVNSFIPNLLTVVRVLAIVFVLAIILEAWSILDFSAWLSSRSGQAVVGNLAGAGLILVIGVAAYLCVISYVEYRMNPNYGSVPTARQRTLLSLFKNAFTIAMVVIVSMLVLSQIGIDIAPLLAGAGVVGLAIGFGAQKFVQDIITGAFIQIQNAMNEGDIVELNGVTGTVEQLTVRSVGLRTIDGTWYLIPFSSVDQVANYSKDFAYYVADIGVAYRENTDDVKAMMFDAFDQLKATEIGDNLIGDFVMFGVQELGDSAVVVRGRVMTKPGTQWGVGRAYREIVKKLADERGIEIPYPHMTVWFGEDSKGNAPPVRVHSNVAQAVEKSAAARDGHLPPPPRGDDAPARSDSQADKGRSQDYGMHDADERIIPPSSGDVDSAGGGRG